jgi:uncharacterized protein (TIGR02466 family)
MIQGEPVSMFPTSLLLNNIGRDFTHDELDCVLEYKDTVRSNTGNITTKDVLVLENPRLAGLKSLVEEALQDYLIQVYNPINPDKIRLVPTQSWLNFTDKTQYHHKHYHHNSIISGCLYINAKRESDSIVFTKRATGEPWQIQALEQNYFNCNEFTVPVNTGDLVLFPSNLIHSVPKTEHEYTRISLAFNSFWDGELGFIKGAIDGINFLRINVPSQQR